MLDWLYELIGTMLAWFSSLFGGSYALALLLYALLFKLLFLPFGIKQQKNQLKMAKLAPKIELIKAKYKGRTDQRSQQKLQQEIMEFQQKEGYSPLSGCLPLLLQLPIIMFLYEIIRKPLSFIAKFSDKVIEGVYRIVNNVAQDATVDVGSIDQISLVSKIMSYDGRIDVEGFDKALIPDFSLFGMNLADTPSFTNFSLLVLIPVIAAALTWLSMWLMRKWNGNTNPAAAAQDAQTAASMKVMDLVMPAMTLVIAFSFSGMLGVYWIYQSLLGIVQSFILSRAIPLPKYTEEEIKEMQKAQKAAEKAAEKAARTMMKEQPKYRSLHYIDEDDYETLPEISAKDDKTEKKTPGGINIPEIKD